MYYYTINYRFSDYSLMYLYYEHIIANIYTYRESQE